MKKLIFILGITLIISCSKPDDSICEKWEVQEWIKDGNTTLSEPHTSTKTMCNDNIKATGTTYIYHTNGSVKYYRKMIRKV